VTSFTAPRNSLGALDADAAAALVSAAADVTLVVDEEGVIHDIAIANDDLARDLEGQAPWLGRAWADTVAEDSRPKVAELLRDLRAGAPTRWRHVNHVTSSGEHVPIMVSAIRIAGGPRAIVFGRDLRPISTLQQRLVEAQASMERDYSRLRQAETRYRLLFQTATEPVLIVEAATGRVVEANPAAVGMLGQTGRRPVGAPLLDLFEPASRDAVEMMLASVRATGRGDDVTARTAAGQRDVVVSATLFRQDGTTLFLLRLLHTLAEGTAVVLPKPKSKLLKLIDSVPDAFVVTDNDGRVITANAAFLEMTQLAAEEQARGEWGGRYRKSI
jgi:transcriptional regulator PpsR